MPYKYNQLLKLNLQKDADVGSIEAEIEDLRQKKVTKFFAATDALESGEIAQYQGDDDSVNGLVNGYFYKKTSTPIILPAGTLFFNNPATTVNLYGYNVTPGNFYLIEDITPEAGNTFFNYHIIRYEDKPNYYFFQEGFDTPSIGDKVWNINNNSVVTVTNITYDEQFRINIILSDGTTIIAYAKTGHLVNSLLTFADSNLNYYSVVNCSEMNVWTFVHYSINGSTFNLIDWFCIEYRPLQPTLSPTTIGSNAFQQVNAQPEQSQVIIRQWTTE